MRAGQLRHYVVVEQPASPVVRSASGAVVKTWQAFATVWARVEPIGGRERFGSSEFAKELTHRVTIRALIGLTSDMRIKLGTRAFDILSVTDRDERGRMMQLECREGRSFGN